MKSVLKPTVEVNHDLLTLNLKDLHHVEQLEFQTLYLLITWVNGPHSSLKVATSGLKPDRHALITATWKPPLFEWN